MIKKILIIVVCVILLGIVWPYSSMSKNSREKQNTEGTVLSLDDCYKKGLNIIRGDGVCFKELGSGLLTDGESLYFNEAKLVGVDGVSAVVLSKTIIKDKTAVYIVRDGVTEKIESLDPEKTYIIYESRAENELYITDDTLYYLIKGNLVTAINKDESPVRLKGSHYVKIADKVYYDQDLVSEASANSIKLIEKIAKFDTGPGVDPAERYYYAKDTKNVYYQGKIVKNADPVTFQVFESNFYQEYARDTRYVYIKDEIIKGADPKTFEVLEEQMYEGCPHGPYNKDAKNIFYGTSTIAGADVATFETARNDYAKDKNSSYKNGVKISTPPNELKVTCEMS